VITKLLRATRRDDAVLLSLPGDPILYSSHSRRRPRRRARVRPRPRVHGQTFELRSQRKRLDVLIRPARHHRHRELTSQRVHRAQIDVARRPRARPIAPFHRRGARALPLADVDAPRATVRVRPRAWFRARGLARVARIVGVDEDAAVPMMLKPGEFSMHHEAVVHGSGPNRSDDRRIGLSIHYIPTHVQRVKYNRPGVKPRAALVRGVDDYGNWEHETPPDADFHPERLAELEEMRREFVGRNREGLAEPD